MSAPPTLTPAEALAECDRQLATLTGKDRDTMLIVRGAIVQAAAAGPLAPGEAERTLREIWAEIDAAAATPTRAQKKTWRRRVSRACHSQNRVRRALIFSDEMTGPIPAAERMIDVGPWGEYGGERLIEAPWLRRETEVT